MAVYGGYACLFQFNGSGSPPGRLRRGETLRKAEKARKILSPAFHNKFIWSVSTPTDRWGPEGVQGAIGKPPGRLRRGETLPKTEKGRKAFPLPSTRNLFICSVSPQQIGGPRRGPGGDRKAPWSPPQRRNPPQNRKREEGFSLALHKKSIYLFRLPPTDRGPRRGPGGDRKAPWSPPQRRNPLQNRKSKEGPFLCLPQEICFLWEVSSACGRTRYFPSLESTQRVPGAAKGCMRHGRPRTPRC